MKPLLLPHKFKREEHIYKNTAFDELVKDAVRFFHGTPVLPMPPPEPFAGSGVYAIYCIARKGVYEPFGNIINRTGFNVPIYVGKATPKGARQGRNLSRGSDANTLYKRLLEHSKSLVSGRGLKLSDFACRFVIFEGETDVMIGAMESAIIKMYSPLWNGIVDGFGNHDPGGKRKDAKWSCWDCLHPGRDWTKKLTGAKQPVSIIKKRITDYFVAKVKNIDENI